MGRKQNEPEAVAVLDAVDVLTEATKTAQGWRDQEERERREAKATAWGEYVTILGRMDAGRAEDANPLAGLMHELGLTPEHVQADRKLARRARALVVQHEEREAPRIAYLAAAAELAATVTRHEQELLAVTLKRDHARIAHDQCAAAAGALRNLRRQRPQLFSDDTDRLTLLCD